MLFLHVSRRRIPCLHAFIATRLPEIHEVSSAQITPLLLDEISWNKSLANFSRGRNTTPKRDKTSSAPIVWPLRKPRNSRFVLFAHETSVRERSRSSGMSPCGSRSCGRYRTDTVSEGSPTWSIAMEQERRRLQRWRLRFRLAAALSSTELERRLQLRS